MTNSRIQCIYSTYILELYSQISNDGGVWTEGKVISDDWLSCSTPCKLNWISAWLRWNESKGKVVGPAPILTAVKHAFLYWCGATHWVHCKFQRVERTPKCYACFPKAHSHSMSAWGSIWASLESVECQCCFWIAGGL
jgi:hypothetical protein